MFFPRRNILAWVVGIMRMKNAKRGQPLSTGEILIVGLVLIVIWAARAGAAELEGVHSLMGREKILELAPKQTRHHVPIKVDSSLGYFLVDEGAGELVVTREFIAANGLWDYHFVKEVPGGDLVELKSVKVGEWVLNDVSAIICDDCQMRAGQSILNQFTLGSRERGGVQYLTITR